MENQSIVELIECYSRDWHLEIPRYVRTYFSENPALTSLTSLTSAQFDRLFTTEYYILSSHFQRVSRESRAMAESAPAKVWPGLSQSGSTFEKKATTRVMDKVSRVTGGAVPIWDKRARMKSGQSQLSPESLPLPRGAHSSRVISLGLRFLS